MSSHLLQPLDVGCFGPLKKAYSHQMKELGRLRHFHIAKEDFIPGPTLPSQGPSVKTTSKELFKALACGP
jgi:hypothetical protein